MPHSGPAPLGHLADLPGFDSMDLPLADAAARITAADMSAVLRSYPADVRRAILRQVGLPAMKSVNPAAAQAVLRLLRRGEPRRHGVLTSMLAAPAEYGFSNPDQLAAGDCVDLLRSAWAGKALRRAPLLAHSLGLLGPWSFVRWCLIRAAGQDLPLAPVALGLLVDDTAGLDADAAAPLRTLWAGLRAREDRLPARPVVGAELRELAIGLMGATGGWPVNVEETMAKENAGGARSDLKGLMEAVTQRFGTAAEAADRLRDSFRSGARPDPADVAAIASAAEEFDAVHERIGMEGEAASLDALREAIAAGDAAERAERVRRLAGLHGPAALEEILGQVRAAVEAEQRDLDGLANLSDLIDLVEDPDAVMAAYDLAERVRADLPAEWHPLIVAALSRRLEIHPHPTPPDGEAAPVRERTGTGKSAPADESSPARAEEAAHAEEAPPVEEAGPVEEAAHAEEAVRVEEAARVKEGMRAEEAASADEAGDSRTEKPSPSESADDDLADLDALLADEAGEGTRPRHAEKRRPTGRTAEGRVPEPKERTAEPAAPAPGMKERTVESAAPAPGMKERTVESGAPGSGMRERTDEPAGKGAGPVVREGSRAETGRPDGAGEIADAEARALRGGRFGLAAWLREAAGRPAAEAQARRCAALARDMTDFAGHLSAEFTEAARGIGAKALAEDPAGRLLAWASVIRAGLVHPTPESTRLLDDLAPVVSSCPGLAAYSESFAHAAKSGAYLVPGISGLMRGSVEVGRSRQLVVHEAAQLLKEGPHRKIRFALATEVWKELLKQDGEIGRLLVLAERDDSQAVGEVADRVATLRAAGALDRLIDDTARRKAGSPGRTKIIARARSQLTKLLEDALELLARWASAVRRSQAASDDPAADRQARLLDGLRESLDRRREDVQRELAEWAAADAGPVAAAAAEAAGALIKQTMRLLSGAATEGAEPPPSHVLHQDLLLAPGVRFGLSPFEPRSTPGTGDLVPVALAEKAEWESAFEARADRSDHDGTRCVIAVLEGADAALAATLRGRRHELVQAARADRDARAEDLRDRLARWLRDGVLTEDDARYAEEALNALTDVERDDFDRVAAGLRDLAGDLGARRAAAIGAARKRLAEQAGENRRIAEASDRIAGLIDDGDLTTAREFVFQVDNGNDLPGAEKAVDHFTRFYPDFPRTFADLATRAGARARRQESSEFINEVKDALVGGRKVADPDLDGLLGRAGIAIPELRNARREESREGLRQWVAIAQSQSNKTPQNLRTAIVSILKMIGLEGVQADGRREPNRMWMDLRDVRWLGDPLLPPFGSRMSPSGDRMRLLLVWRRPGAQQLIQRFKDEPADQTVLVLYFGVLSAEERRQLAAASRRRPAPVAGVLDDAAISYLACMPEADWSTTVSLLAPFTSTNPYAAHGEVPEEMFAGRTRQLQQVISRSGSSFVYGGRQLGKSALLRKAELDIRAKDRHRAVVSQNIQTVGKTTGPESLWPGLAEKLELAGVIPSGDTDRDRICRDVRAWVEADPRRQVLILLDEADSFLNRDATDSTPFGNVTELRDLMAATDQRVKVVFAGLHQTERFQSLPNQPLPHLGAPIAVGPLQPQDAFDLLVRPLATLGFRFPETLAARVIAEANNAPAIVQMFAEELLTRLRRIPVSERILPYEITRDDIDAVWRDSKLANGFRKKFELTLDLDKRYKVIAYTVALHALDEGPEVALDVNELWEQCRDWWPAGFKGCSGDAFRGLLDECVNLGVLGVDADRYRLRTPHILNLLGGAADVEAVLEKTDEFEPPDSFDAQSYRAVYRDGPERSPLTGGQIAGMLRRRDFLHVVAGSRALHVERVAAALEAEVSAHRDVHVLRVGKGRLTLEGAIERARRHAGHSLVVVDLDHRNLQQTADRYRAAQAEVARGGRGTLAVVLVTSSELAALWAGVRRQEGGPANLIELQRFDRAAVRLWMYEETDGFQDATGQDALLECTGGWPTLIGKVVGAQGRGGVDREQMLEGCREYLRYSAREFVRSTGVLATPPLAAAWWILVDERPDTGVELAELLTLYSEEGDKTELAAPALAANGYRSTADLVEVLRMLGALVPGPDGRMSGEPVLADATRRARKPDR